MEQREIGKRHFSCLRHDQVQPWHYVPLFITPVGDAPYTQERQSVDGASGLPSEVRLDMMINGVGADDDAVSRPRHRSTEHSAGVNGEFAGVRYHWAMPF